MLQCRRNINFLVARSFWMLQCFSVVCCSSNSILLFPSTNIWVLESRCMGEGRNKGEIVLLFDFVMAMFKIIQKPTTNHFITRKESRYANVIKRNNSVLKVIPTCWRKVSLQSDRVLFLFYSLPANFTGHNDCRTCHLCPTWLSRTQTVAHSMRTINRRRHTCMGSDKIWSLPSCQPALQRT